MAHFGAAAKAPTVRSLPDRSWVARSFEDLVGLRELVSSPLAPPAANAPPMLGSLGPRGAGPIRAGSAGFGTGRVSPGQAGWQPPGSVDGSGSRWQRPNRRL